MVKGLMAEQYGKTQRERTSWVRSMEGMRAERPLCPLPLCITDPLVTQDLHYLVEPLRQSWQAALRERYEWAGNSPCTYDPGRVL